MISVERIENHSYLAHLLSPASTVVDLGMNAGLFSSAIVSRHGCRVFGAEPVPELFEALPQNEKIVASEVAITGRDATVFLHRNSLADCATTIAGLGHATAAPVPVRSATLATFLHDHRLRRIDLLKLDIEGAELDVLAGTERSVLREIGQITVEFHAFLNPATEQRVAQVQERLSGLGFVRLRFSRDDTDVLFVNQGRYRLSLGSRLFLALGFKYRRGVGRVLKRLGTQAKRRRGPSRRGSGSN